MSELNRKNFSSQLKAKVALEAIGVVKTVTEIAQEFGAHPTQVEHWKKYCRIRLRAFLMLCPAQAVRSIRKL
jgi:transposase-like protein